MNIIYIYIYAACWVAFSSSLDDSFALKRANCVPPPSSPSRGTS